MAEDLTINTPFTRALGIKYPILLAGMNKASGPKLAAAVTNAGGLGVIGGLGFTPRILRLTIKHLKNALTDKNSYFGVDFPLAQVGGSARKTNYDYQKGKLDELIDVVIESGNCKLFVSAIGIPTKQVVDRLHKHGIFVMNMIGHPKHVQKACAVGVDALCVQGSEGGGHTGEIPTSILLPKIVDLVNKHGYRSPLTGELCYVVGAGGIYNGRGLAMSIMAGCDAVWVGTRFVASTEAAASDAHKRAIVNASYEDTMRSEVYSGRPLRMIKNRYVVDWATRRKDEMQRLLESGVIPFKNDYDEKKGVVKNKEVMKRFTSVDDVMPYLSGQVAGGIDEILPAKVIVDQMMKEAIEYIRRGNQFIVPYNKRSKL
eukprot:CAMPEP_0197074230 /NCGR_PEP_ID=MMETSP1384-20130603/211007_1 /TAXON_ID=29189 /ORGANISM="Ammonia sp." /LENGTH=371 /DNA_ID=CAMNT_0042513071 /DNA_START=8 /DNA_END=1123 /DNA_ORIENTATION=+